MDVTLELLGLTKEELQDRIVALGASQLLNTKGYDEDGDEYPESSALAKKLSALVQEKINAHIARLGDEKVLPMVAGMIDGVVLQATSKWGEKQGNPLTFVEYLVQRSEAYIREPVDFQGKAKGDGDSYNWKSNTTRLMYMIDKHLQYHIDTALKAALQTANAALAKGIEDGVKIKLAELLAGIKATVMVK